MKTQNKVALGLAGGALLGALAGVILAPKSGKQARSVIFSRANQLRQRVKRSGNGGGEPMGDYAEIAG